MRIESSLRADARSVGPESQGSDKTGKRSLALRSQSSPAAGSREIAGSHLGNELDRITALMKQLLNQASQLTTPQTGGLQRPIDITKALGERGHTLGNRPPAEVTTLAVGEEGNPPGNPATPDLTTLALGEEGGPGLCHPPPDCPPAEVTTLALGEEGNPPGNGLPMEFTTLAVGEEGNPPSTPEMTDLTTMALGEEGGPGLSHQPSVESTPLANDTDRSVSRSAWHERGIRC